MILYHGTSDIHYSSIITNGLKKGTCNKYNWHALKIANRTSKRDGGIPIVIKFDMKTPVIKIKRRHLPAYQYTDEQYKLISIIILNEKEIEV
jgi:hypothetical protein